MPFAFTAHRHQLEHFFILFDAFKHRKPWATAIVTFILGPALGMFYLGKARQGMAYLVIGYVILFSPFLLTYMMTYFDLLGLDFVAIRFRWLITMRIIGVPHCYFVAKRWYGRKPQEWFARCSALIILILVEVVVVSSVFSFLFRPFNVTSGTMLPNLRIGDYLIVSKSSYGYSRFSLPFSPELFHGRILAAKPERGDVVLFRLPKEVMSADIRRIIGLPGDRIQMIKGIVHINGKPVKREKVREHEISGLGAIDYRETLSNGASHLIREYGDAGYLDDTPEYNVPEGQFFVLGDNRDNSTDSRAMKRVGFVPFENLIGKVGNIFWNSNDQKIRF